MPYTEFDERMMQRALSLALAGVGYVSPNPLVGCVICDDSGWILGEGAHLAFGGPHAEVNAILNAEASGHSVRGATAYVTLEPHAHTGKTPPCTKLLIEKGIARCIIAMEDPNPKVSGMGIRELRDAGIEVQVGLLEDEAREMNRFFIKHITTGLPYVTMKLASTLDGRSALASGESQWITSLASRTIVHQLRALHDAVLIGARTALLDDPELTVRYTSGRQPRRIVLDARLELPHTLKHFTDKRKSDTIIVTTPKALAERGDEFVPMGFELMSIEGSNDRIDLPQMLRQLGGKGVSSLLIEAGQTLAASILQQDLCDELDIFYGPLIFGSDGRPSVGPMGLLSIENAHRLSLKSVERVEGSEDIHARYRKLDMRNERSD
jgi:diaminohydroxyphosphoribosylaminopyrimidine deaminase/5-amino-6-(5-phosphoribosylamino)uracil reductase